jgi:pSer/pThr/pTyr-binding forkhead associated (FHA) protein
MSERADMTLAEACGLGGPLELLVRPAGEAGGGELRPFDRPFVVLGRDPCNDLWLDAPEVSQRHAYLQVIAGHLFCVDLGSRTGLHWEGGRRPAGWLAPGQAIRVGPFEVLLVSPGRSASAPGPAATPDWSPTETRVPDASAGWAGSVELSRDGRIEARCRLTRVLTLVGRSPACRLRLSSRDVVRYHCGLLRTPAAVWAIDLSGDGGIRVGGTRVPWARLADGDRLEVGPYVMWLRRAYDVVPAATGALTPPVSILMPPPPQPVALDAALLGPAVQQFALMQQQMFDQFHQAMMAIVQMFGALHRDQMGLIRGELDRLQAVSQELNSLRAELTRQPPAHPTAAPNGPVPQQAPAPEATGQPAPGAAAAARPAEAVPAPGATVQGDPGIHVWLSQRIEALEQERQSRWQKVMSFVLGK